RMLKYQESEAAIAEYLGNSLNYNVTYQTIESGLNVEALVGTGSCINGSEVVENDGATMMECNSCFCSNGVLACTLMACPEE
ncbi:hypothetical protein C0416_02525, partial [bacterium]|nr:hypothetical protein [bacterium]